jgi:hypothetical protein
MAIFEPTILTELYAQVTKNDEGDIELKIEPLEKSYLGSEPLRYRVRIAIE